MAFPSLDGFPPHGQIVLSWLLDRTGFAIMIGKLLNFKTGLLGLSATCKPSTLHHVSNY